MPGLGPRVVVVVVSGMMPVEDYINEWIVTEERDYKLEKAMTDVTPAFRFAKTVMMPYRHTHDTHAIYRHNYIYL